MPTRARANAHAHACVTHARALGRVRVGACARGCLRAGACVRVLIACILFGTVSCGVNRMFTKSMSCTLRYNLFVCCPCAVYFSFNS